MDWQFHNGSFSIEWDGLKVYRSERFVFTVQTRNQRSKILQIFFWKNGSIFIDFPFFSHTTGVASLINYPANTKPPIKLSFIEQGKVTSHLVKFSYPPDGNAHFSQDGKVYTKVRKACPPLSKINGHFFTAQVQGLDAFEKFESSKEKMTKPKEKIYTEAVFANKVPPAIKIVGMLYSREQLRRRTPEHFFGPKMLAENPQGKRRLACFCSSPFSVGEDLILALMCEAVPSLNKQEKAVLSFIGGFDERSVVEDPKKDSDFLALVYPAENVEELTQKIGSIDFIRKTI